MKRTALFSLPLLTALILACLIQLLPGEDLLQPGDLTYIGAFKVPQGILGPEVNYSGIKVATFQNSTGVFCHDPASNQLYLTGHPYGQLTAAVTIPVPVKSTSPSALPFATLAVPFRQVTSGTGLTIGYGTGIFQVLGLAVDGGRLYWSAGTYYNVDGTNKASQGFSNLLSNPSIGATGPWYLAGQHIQRVAGPATLAPQDFADQYTGGRRVVAGRYTAQGIATTSCGPTLYAYSVGEPPPAKDSSLTNVPIIFWPSTAQYPGHLPNDEYNGVAFVKGSVIWTGRKSGGSYYGDPRPGDCETWKGYHGDPYSPRVWFFSQADLGSAAMTGLYQQPRAYATWSPPEFWPNCTGRLGGCAYDLATRRLYVVQTGAYSSNGSYPVIHVYEVAGSSTPPPPADTVGPAAPTNLRIVKG